MSGMRRQLPSTQALACFEAAARHESYTRAAQELALTQSAVSRQILALEDQLGVQLFRRTRHGVVLTPAGRHYARQVARWLQALEQDGFINRVSRPVVPPHVEYSLTPLGEQVRAKVAALADWIQLNRLAAVGTEEQTA